MKSMLKKAIIVSALMAAVLAIFNTMPIAMAQLVSPDDAPSLITAQTGGETSLRALVKTILNFILGFLGFIAIIYLIYAGFLYVTAGGNDENTGKAKKIILYTIIGIIVIIASAAIVNTVLDAPTGNSQVTAQ